MPCKVRFVCPIVDLDSSTSDNPIYLSIEVAAFLSKVEASSLWHRVYPTLTGSAVALNGV